MGDVPLWGYGLPVLGTTLLAMATLLRKRSPADLMPVHWSLRVQCLSAAAIFAAFAWHKGRVVPVLGAAFVGGILCSWAAFAAGGLCFVARRRVTVGRRPPSSTTLGPSP